MKKIFSFLYLFQSALFGVMLISAGGYDVSKYQSTYTFKQAKSEQVNVNITEVLQKKSKNVNAVTIWITKDWQEDWYDVRTTQKEIIDKGYTPVFIFYWFADDVSVEFIKKHEKEYFKTLEVFLKYLKKLDGQKIVVLNPEYNMGGTEKWDGMNDIFLKSYKVLRKDPQVLVGPCVGDFGNYSKVNEVDEWKLFHPSIKRAALKADFIAFQEMRALTRNSKSDILNTGERARRLAKYLYKTYKKPTMLPYLAISTHGKSGEYIQKSVYQSFKKLLPIMEKESKFMLFGTFHYFDYTGHVGYFNEAEEFFGLLHNNGLPKESLLYFNQLK